MNFLSKVINKTRITWKALAFAALLILGLGMPQEAEAAYDYKMLQEAKWIPDKGCIEVWVMFYDNWGSGQDIHLKWDGGKYNSLYFDGIKVANIGMKRENWIGGGNYEHKWQPLAFKSYVGNNRLEVYAYASEFSDKQTDVTSTTKQWFMIPGYTADYTRIIPMHSWSDGTVTNLGDDQYPNNRNFVCIRYYPDNITYERQITIKIWDVAWAHEENNNLDGQSTNPMSLVQTSVTVMPHTAVGTQEIINGTIQSTGKVKVSCTAGDADRIGLLINGRDAGKTKNGSSVTFDEMFLTTASDFLYGVTFGFNSQKVYGDNVRTIRTSDKTLVSQRAAIMNNDISAEMIDDGKIKVKWTVTNPSVEAGRQNTSPFKAQIKKVGVTTWNDLTDVPFSAQNGGKSNYSTEYEIPITDMNKGEVVYEYRVTRIVGFDDALASIFQRNGTIKVNTNEPTLDNLKIEPGGPDLMPKLTWTLRQHDFIGKTGYLMNFLVDGTEYDIPKDSIFFVKINDSTYNGTYQTYAQGIEPCKPQNYALNIKYKDLEKTIYPVNESYVFQPKSEREFSSVIASRGYFTDRVNLKWTITPHKEDFTAFRIERRELSDSGDDWVRIAQVNHDRGTLFYNYDDKDASAGVYYLYRVVGVFTCSDNAILLNSDEKIGFSQPYGSLSGRITYTGSQAVEGVKVLMLSGDGNAVKGNRELLFPDGQANAVVTIPDSAALFNRDGFSVQFWMKMSDRNDRIILKNDSVCTLELKDSKLFFTLKGSSKSVNSEVQLIDNKYYNVTLTVAKLSDYKNYEVSLYLDSELRRGETMATMVLPAELSAKPAKTTLTMPNGVIDDIRLWNRPLTASEIAADYDRVITGKEEGIVAYYKCDEIDSVTTAIFDCSASGTRFNGNDAVISTDVKRIDVDSRATHMGIRGITDANGTYTILNAVPYTREGTSYSVSPSFGVHQFDPNKRPLYFSPESKVFNNVDFTDISSFNVSGKIIYDDGTGTNSTGGKYPVTGCSFEIDDKPVTNAQGKLITNDAATGEFTISVPIGVHKVRVVKTGHKFVDDGLLLNNSTGENLNFNAPVANIVFRDLTKVKLVGRIVGGMREYNKVLGFGESKNNIGVTTFMLKSQKSSYEFVDPEHVHSETVEHNNGEWKKPVKPGDIQNDQTVVTYNPYDITIKVSPRTGEFEAYVYPEIYTIDEIKVPAKDGAKLTIYNKGETLDLTSSTYPDDSYLKTSVRTWVDSSLVTKPGVPDSWAKTEHSDTVRYNAEWKYYYQSKPTFSVTQLDGTTPVEYFGDATYVLHDSQTDTDETIDLWNDYTQQYRFGKPVFQQGNTYKFMLKAYEEYVNYVEDPPLVTKMEVEDGTVDMKNEIRVDYQPETVTLDNKGAAVYTFTAGTPDLTTGQHSFYATLTLGGQAYPWTFDPTPYVVWHLGQKMSGTNFMTSGPDQISAILRDPPGSHSYSYIEKGTAVTTTTTDNITAGESSVMDLTTSLGASITTFVGLGAGIIETSEVVADVKTGITSEASYSYDTESSVTSTFTERIETSPETDFVGAQGDVYIGYSTNILYGMTDGFSIQKGMTQEPVTQAGDYSIARTGALAYGQNFATRFVYTQRELEEIMIPKWQQSIAMRLMPVGYVPNTAVITAPVYVSKLAPDDPNYGKMNTDKVAFPNASPTEVYDGPSYKLYLPASWTAGSKEMQNFQDSIIWANNQIKGWTNLMAQNEKEKIEMVKKGNYSFGGGAAIENSQSYTASKSYTNTYSFAVSPSLGAVAGFEVFGIGFELETSTTITTAGSSSTTHTEEQMVTTGFVLAEEGTTDEITVDYGSTASGTVAFKTRGGQTSCPYEGEVRTKYYRPGTLIDEATMQIEVPVISVSSAPSVINVPANRAATFMLDLKNESETNDDVWFQLTVDDKTNPNGADVRIDNLSIGNGRIILVPAGEVLNKTLTILKGTVDRYDNIAVIMQSLCDEIADTVFLSATFVPACSEVAVSSPKQNWILNSDNPTGDTLAITIDGFDVNFPNFGYIRLQYRPVSSPDWNTITTFYPPSLYENATGTKENIGTRSTLNYLWKMPNADGAYELRAVAASVSSSNGVIIGDLSSFTTDAITGFKDMQKPASLGAPSPSNGILAAGDELSITFNEDIQSGMLTKNNFSITGVLNAQEIAEPNTGLKFDGTGVAHTAMPIYAGSSFSIETWFKRTPGTKGTLFSYGGNSNYVTLSINERGIVSVTMGEQKITASHAIADDETWKYIALCYNKDTKTVSVYEYEGSSSNNLVTNAVVGTDPEMQGTLYVGNDAESTSGFSGSMARLHFYGANRTEAAVAIDKSLTKSGRELNLIGYWEMDEGIGSTAKDKSRARDLTLNTGWYIYPSGKAIALSGQSSALSIPTGTYPLDALSDATVEFWFKGSTSRATLFYFAAGNIGFDDNGRLLLYKNDDKNSIIQTLSDKILLDEQWHHFALSVKRRGMAKVYVDNVNVATFSETLVGSLASGYYYFGARRMSDKTFDACLKGAIDEIRIWSSALTAEGIALNRNNKLNGTEDGLLAYYPFETYVKQSNGLITVVESMRSVTDDMTATGGTISDNAVSVKDVRPEEAVPFEFVASNNKVVLTIDENYFSRVEGVTLNVSAKNIRDMHNNLSNVERWTAFANRNPLRWLSTGVKMMIEEAVPQTFTASIVNNGGVTANYSIENLPDWLSVSSVSGTLRPLASTELTFTIYEGINVGSYEASVELTSGNGVNEILPVQLKVTGNRPEWTVNKADFESSMIVTGRVQITGVNQEDTDDLLAAFIGNTCVGVTSPLYVSELNACYTFMTVYGNNSDAGKLLTFKFWDAGTGRIYSSIDNTVGGELLKPVFEANSSAGDVITPVIHNAQNINDQLIDLERGWNWLSFNVENTNPSLLEQFKTNIGAAGQILKGRDGYTQSPTWGGSLTTVTTQDMYMTQTNAPVTLSISGSPIDAATTPITLTKGWNWIGFTPQYNLPVANALAGLNPLQGDQIKGRDGYRTYMGSNFGWIGNLSTMRPGEGYMYYSTADNPVTFNYPTVTGQTARSARSAMSALDAPATQWSCDKSKYANTMTVTAIVMVDGEALSSSEVEIAAFAGNECRGSIMLQKEGDACIGFLNIFGTGNELLSFKVYDHASATEYINVRPYLTFVANDLKGRPDQPFVLNAIDPNAKPTGVDDIDSAETSHATSLQAYPNPTTGELSITNADVMAGDMIEVLTTAGKLVKTFTATGQTTHLSLDGLASGTYVLRIARIGATVKVVVQ